MRRKSQFFLYIFLYSFLNISAQNNLVGSYAITAVERQVYNGDSVFAIYQPDNVIFVDRDNQPEYSKGLPDSLPNVPDGKYILFNTPKDSTKPYIREIGFYKNNKKDSICESYYPNGNKCEVIYFKNNGKYDRQIEWDENGILKSDLSFKNGLLNGICRIYNNYDEEWTFGVGEFVNGETVGKWIYYFDLIDTLSYKIEKYYDGYEIYKYAEKTFHYDTVIYEECLTKKYRIIKKNGIITEKRNLKTEKRNFKKDQNKREKERKKKEKELKNRILIKGIKFNPSFTHLDTISYKILDKYIELFKNNSEWVIELSFHTKYPIVDYNEPDWIHNTIEYFINNGISASRIIAKNFSTNIPLRRKFFIFKRENQRIEWRIIKK